MEYPVYINGKKTGVLSVRRDGLMTAFEADCEYAEGLLRLWVYGDGEPLPDRKSTRLNSSHRL